MTKRLNYGYERHIEGNVTKAEVIVAICSMITISASLGILGVVLWLFVIATTLHIRRI